VPNAKFCASCGTPTSAWPAQAVPATPTKRKPWFWVATIVIVILAFLGGASISPERVITTTNTYVSTYVITRTVTSGPIAVTTGILRVKIGQTFATIGRDQTPVEVTFTKVWYADKAGYSTADKGYKFVAIDIALKNVGVKETSGVFSSLDSSWTAKVDRGYLYNAKSTWYLPGSVRPEEIKTGYVYFEILQDTTAIEIRTRLLYANVDLIIEL